MASLIARHRTALSRRRLSRPFRIALEHGLINAGTGVFDYGCGRGDDIRHLKRQGITSTGWDPIYYPKEQRSPSDIINLGYVVNVIEDASERSLVLREAWSLARKLLIVSARLTIEAKDCNYQEYEDGCLTKRATFQKYFQQHELRDWIDNVLGVSSVAVAPGIFYVFRDSVLRQSFLASRYRRAVFTPSQHTPSAIFEEHKELFEPLMAFIASRGRLPDDSEMALVRDIRQKVGSLNRAFAIIRHVTGQEQWDNIRHERSQELLIYLALARFGGRPRLLLRPHDIQLVVSAFFSTYNRACALADELLFSAGKVNLVDEACRKSQVGKLTPGALYVHSSAISHLSPVLRIYEGCARAYIGAVEGANIIKLHRRQPQISYLAYPEFERDPHPTLFASLIVPLQTFHIQYREYTDSKNPPILHRKEEFVSTEHPLRPKFARLTRQEEQSHLYDSPESIGTRDGWQKVLDEHKVKIQGHRLLCELVQQRD